MLLCSDYVLLMHMLFYNKFDFSLFHQIYSIQHMHCNKTKHVYDDRALMELDFDLFLLKDLLLQIGHFHNIMQV